MGWRLALHHNASTATVLFHARRENDVQVVAYKRDLTTNSCHGVESPSLKRLLHRGFEHPGTSTTCFQCSSRLGPVLVSNGRVFSCSAPAQVLVSNARARHVGPQGRRQYACRQTYTESAHGPKGGSFGDCHTRTPLWQLSTVHAGSCLLGQLGRRTIHELDFWWS